MRKAEKVLARRGNAFILAEIQVVHAYECPNWRSGKRNGPCNCGAQELWERYQKVQGDADPFSGIKMAPEGV